MIPKRIIICLILGYTTVGQSSKCENPHTIVMIADDMGWNDISMHGSKDIPTPEIDSMACHGMNMERHYSCNLCTPSRSALQTGMMPYKLGMQGNPIVAGSKSALSTHFKLMPEYFKELGYSTHLVGKWHLGTHKRCYWPTNRGWDEYYGAINGYTAYSGETHFLKQGYYGGDTYHNEKEAFCESTGDYITHSLTQKAVDVIRNHSDDKPLLLMLSHNGPHANNPGAALMLRTPNGFADEKLNHIKSHRRKAYADACKEVDDSVARVIQALHEKDMLKCSNIAFFSDNGGPTVDEKFGYENEASNWPLRGMKMSPFEGGVRTVAAMWSHELKYPKTYRCLFHLTDWLPTLYEAAGGNVTRLKHIDGMSHWRNFKSNYEDVCIRNEIFTELSDESQSYINGDMKVVKSFSEDNIKKFSTKFYGSSGRGESSWTYDDITKLVVNSNVSKILYNHYRLHDYDVAQMYQQKRNHSMLDKQCMKRIKDPQHYANCTDFCLFDLKYDPCETTDLSLKYPELLKAMKATVEAEMKLMVPKVDYDTDPRAKPHCWNNMWTTWLDPHPLVNYTCEGPIPGANEPASCINDWPPVSS